MKWFQYMTWFFGTLTLLLSHTACVVVAYQYCAIEYMVYGHTSAPAYVAFYIPGIPFALGILACGTIALLSYRAYRRTR